MANLKVAELANKGILIGLDPDQSLYRVIENKEIPNGMSWIAADDILYVTDLPLSYNCDAEAGTITKKKRVFTSHWRTKLAGFATDQGRL
ncbi:hypothetical protein ACJ73_05717 [Blastomyces percursus]|uniref:SMP-30/Gluconolactonase/LRE-like region domain-containing protein n=1 Tax=Blastomyces percursus TaxID=1658174 RepID=A0A1J9Q4B3_9EURO|nr:hypothetical protein ACJ73_05717 [Blastomyces percursus]